jgi:hypothetical protein
MVMATATQDIEITPGARPLGVAGVEEPILIQYEDRVWSCREKKEVLSRLYYSVTTENGRHTCRLLFIEPLV